jgi:ribokinase
VTTSSAPRVVCVACWNVDLTLRVARLPGAGETVFGDAFDIGPGGKGSNVAVGAARLGARVDVVARLGDDEYGRRALPFWRAEGIDVTHTWVAAGEPNAVASILVAPDGENQIAVFRGAGFRLDADLVRAARPAFERARIVTLPLEVQDEAVGAALGLARECGARSILNPAPARALPAEWLRLVDVLTPNALEARQLCGLPAGATPADLGRALLERGVGAVVMTCGAEGAWLFEPGQAPLPVPPCGVHTVSTVGAGDAFNAGLAVVLAEGASLHEAARFAAAVAALATTREGAALAMPRRAEVQSLMSRSPIDSSNAERLPR